MQWEGMKFVNVFGLENQLLQIEKSAIREKTIKYEEDRIKLARMRVDIRHSVMVKIRSQSPKFRIKLSTCAGCTTSQLTDYCSRKKLTSKASPCWKNMVKMFFILRIRVNQFLSRT